MKRLSGVVGETAKWQRILTMTLTLIFMLSVIMAGTTAWADMSQHKTNIAEGEGSPKRTNAVLQKYEKDKQGNKTEIPVPGAEFTLYKVNADGTSTRMETFVTGTDGQILALELEPGDYYWQETRPANGFLPEIEDGQAKKYYFSVPTNDGKQAFTIAYNTRCYGNIALTKTVKNSDNSELSEAQKDLVFEFTITFSDGGSYDYSIDNAASQTVASGGKIYLKSGQTAQIIDIPVGIRYEIVETPVSGYTTTSKNSAGNVPEEGITAAFTNTYNVIPDGCLTITKQVTGDGADLDKEFTFTAVGGGRTETFTLKHGESKTFDNIPYGTEYTITEADYSADGYTSQPREYKGTVTADNNAITLPFVNHYDDDSEDKVGSLKVKKTVTGHTGTDKEFTFTITFEGAGAPPSPQTFTLKHGQSKVFSDIPHGVQYTVTEAETGGYSPEFTTMTGVIVGDQTATVGFVNYVPQSLTLTVTKRVIGNPPEEDKDKLFHFILTINEEKHEFDLKPGEVSEEFTVYSGDKYSLEERDYIADGYFQSGVVNGAGIVGNVNIEIIQSNKYIGPEYIDIDGVKTWNVEDLPPGTQLPDSITILLKNGDQIVRSVTTNEDKDWKYEFENLPKHDALGNEIHYTVEEVRVPGWRPVITGYDIENIYQPPVTEDNIPVEKIITGVTPPANETFAFVLTPVNEAPMPDNHEIMITGAGEASFGKIIYTVPGTYVYTITEVDGGITFWSYDASVYTLTVTVDEDDNGELTVSKTLTQNDGSPAEKASFTNHYDDSGETISVRVTKVWKGDDDNHPQSVEVQLYKDGTPYENPVTLSIANGWTREWSGLDRHAVWTVKEVNVPEGYTESISGDQANGFVITNTKDDSEVEKTSVKVTKVWKGEDNNRPQSIAAQLYKDDTPMDAPVTLSADNNWTYTWDNLEKGPKWTVDEVNVPTGYSKAVVGDAANGFVITNTKTPVSSEPDEETVVISGKKTWNHGTNPTASHPTAITLIIRGNGDIVSQRRITAEENWSWSIRLPKYDDDGKLITYTVDESSIGNYSKTVDGYNLINTYSPGSETVVSEKSGSGKGDSGDSISTTPVTGDTRKVIFWLIMMLLSLIGIIATIIPWKRKYKGRL